MNNKIEGLMVGLNDPKSDAKPKIAKASAKGEHRRQ
jgi:hypothetical protein